MAAAAAFSNGRRKRRRGRRRRRRRRRKSALHLPYPGRAGPGRGSSVAAAAAFISSSHRWRMERFLKQASGSRQVAPKTASAKCDFILALPPFCKDTFKKLFLKNGFVVYYSQAFCMKRFRILRFRKRANFSPRHCTRSSVHM